MSNRLIVPAVLTALVLSGCASAGRDCRCQVPADPIVQERAFLAKNALNKGVISLPGLQYMVLQSGPATGAHPKRTDDITVRYEGRFLNGQVFNASPNGGLDTITFQLEKLIPGWGAALQMMRPGDIWMLYVPSNLAYGEAGKSYIPPYSTLVFRVELVAVSPHVDPPPPAPPPPPVVAAPVPPPPPPPPPAPAEKPKPKPVHHRKPKPKPAEDGSDGGSTSDDGSSKSIFKGSEQ